MRFLDRIVARLAEWRGFHVSESPPGWVAELSGWATGTGLTITPDKALELTDVYACVRVLAESVAMLPLVTYRRVGDGGKERARDYHLYPLLHDAPNPEMTAFTFRETLMGHVLTWGNAYAEIDYNNAGRINALWPLRPDRMDVERVDGRLRYQYRLPSSVGGQEVDLPAERVFHLRGLAFDGRVGYSPIGLQRQAVGLGMATEQYAARFFRNDARPGGVLTHPGRLSDEAYERLREEWAEQHQGLDNAHRVAILEEGLDYKAIGLPPEDAQFISTAKLSTVKVARMYRVPLHLIQEQEKQTSWGTGIEQMNIGFVVYTLMPWLERWEQEIALSMMTVSDRGSYFVEHLVAGLLRGDTESRYNSYAIGRQWGWLSANDVRRMENMNPVDGGDTYLVPLNMIPAGQSGMEPDLEDDERALRIADYARTPAPEVRAQGYARERHRLALTHLRLYEDVAARVLRRERNDVGNAARRWLTQRDVSQFSDWLARFYRDHRGFVADQFGPLEMSYGEMVVAAARGEVDEPQEMTDGLEDWIRNYLDTFAARHVSVSEGRIRSVMRDALDRGEEPLAAVESELEGWPEARAQETARWEAFRYNNALAVAVYLGARKQRIRWVAFGDSCPYCSELDGQIVGIRQFFLPAGTDYQPDGAERPLHVSHNIGHAPAHDGCDCMTVSA